MASLWAKYWSFLGVNLQSNIYSEYISDIMPLDSWLIPCSSRQTSPPFNPDCQFVQQSCIWQRPRSLRTQKMFTKKTWVSVFLRSSFKSPLQSRLTLRLLYLERVNPGEMDVESVKIQQETWEDETWSTTTAWPSKARLQPCLIYGLTKERSLKQRKFPTS